MTGPVIPELNPEEFSGKRKFEIAPSGITYIIPRKSTLGVDLNPANLHIGRSYGSKIGKKYSITLTNSVPHPKNFYTAHFYLLQTDDYCSENKKYMFESIGYEVKNVNGDEIFSFGKEDVNKLLDYRNRRATRGRSLVLHPKKRTISNNLETTRFNARTALKDLRSNLKSRDNYEGETQILDIIKRSNIIYLDRYPIRTKKDISVPYVSVKEKDLFQINIREFFTDELLEIFDPGNKIIFSIQR